jgi:phosphohistidine phosphatase SixA/8-oxo-dGTP pyrophosphatase MutT (NUDIX family)
VSELILAAGALVWRPAAGGTEVLLVHRPRYDDWSWPKGKREPGEHLLITAVREVFEESSVRPVLGPRLPTTEYLAAGRPKRVDYWSAVGPDSSAEASHEIDAVSWVPLAQAAGQLSYAHDATVLAALRPRPTVPLILLRHASAGQRTAHPDDDARRPLDAEGAIDARLLAGLLACFAPRARVLSSPALRCLETVQPYAAGFGGSVEAEPALAVPRRPSDSSVGRTSVGDSLATLVRDLVAADRAAVVCLHRENLPQALAATCAALGAPTALPGDPELPKGGFWVVHAASGSLAALERYDLREPYEAQDPQDPQDPQVTLRMAPE